LAAQPISVSELTAYIQDIFAADELLSDVWVEGEVTERFTSRGGHVFFTFADDDCKLPCVMFRGAARGSPYIPVPGQSCAAHGTVSVYGREGRYQLYVDFVQSAGIGLAALEFELLKQQLAAEGLFEESRKRAVPERVRTIGVVTSPDGAVWHDIMTVVARRDPFVHLILSPAAVQGDAAPASLREALSRLLEYGQADVIIIGRGGGSVSDLAAFNDEMLVRATYASPIPIVSAVGHETDWTLLDLVADVRAPTPSAAAELCTIPARDGLGILSEALGRLRWGLVRDVGEAMLQVDELRNDLVRFGPPARIPQLRSILRQLLVELQQGAGIGLARNNAMLSQAQDNLFDSLQRQMSAMQQHRDHKHMLLQMLSPMATLTRGYATLTDTITGEPVHRASGARAGQQLTVRVHDGRIESVVEAVQQG
jgi:exodeoxyribonuclease VII large subunit